MRYKLLILFFIPICLFGKNEIDNECNCSVVLYYKQIKVPLFDDKGKVLCCVMNDTTTEDYFGVIIMKINKNNRLAYVSASATLYDTIPKIGWIETKNLGIYPSKFSTINLYYNPNIDSKIKSKIFKPEYFPFNILDCKENWLYISYLDTDGKIKEGWLSPEDQCSNPYSTCN